MSLRPALLIVLCSILSGQMGEALPQGRSFFHEYGDREGFQSRGVTSLAEDAHGFLYVGTVSGLFRYNGAKFEPIAIDSESHSRWVLALAPHSVDGMWVGTLTGLAFVHGPRVRWASFPDETGHGGIHTICTDPRGRAWVMGRKGLYRQGRDDRFTLDPANAGWSHPRLALGTGPVVASGPHTVWNLEGKDRWTERTTVGLDLTGPSFLLVDGQGTLWAGKNRQVWRLPPQETAWQPIPTLLPEPILADGTPSALRNGGLALLTLQSLVQIRGDAVQIMNPARGLPEEEILTCLEDRRGTLWVGGSGLYRKLGTDRFQVFTDQDGLPDRRTWCIHRSRSGRLYVGTQSGVATLAGSRFLPVPGLQGTRIQRIREDPTGGLWFLTLGQATFHLPPGATRASRVPALKEPVSAWLPRAGGGADVVLLETGLTACQDLNRPHAFTPQPLQPKTAPGTLFLFASRDPNGRIALATSDGLHILDKGRWHSFRKAQGLLADGLMNVQISPDGTYWITYLDGHGITRAKPEGDSLGVVDHLREGGALPTDTVYEVLPRQDGGAWVLTSRGLVSWFPDRYHLYTTWDGIGSNDCNEGTLWEDPDGTLWFGTTRGLVRGREIASRGAWPMIRLTSQSTALGARMFPHEPPITELPYRKAGLTFNFAPRQISEDRTVLYQICLSGHDQGWRGTPSPSADYAGLREGAYTFLVRGGRPGEPWGPTAALEFRVLPPWHRSWWGWSLWVLTGTGALWGISQLRVQTITHQRNSLNQEVLLRTQEIQEAREALEVANEALQAQTVTDPLTHLKNRRFLDLTLPADLARASLPHLPGADRRLEKGPEDLIFLLVDLDRFKVINDTHGHHTGDEVLRQTAGVLKSAMRESDALVRWGGEEFLLLARKADRREGGQIAERIRSLVSTHPFEVGLRSPLHVTCSVGFAPFPMDGPSGSISWERVVDLADQCLYTVKRSGRNGWLGLLDGRLATTHAGNVKELRNAADRGEIDLLTSLEGLDWGG